MLQGLITLFRPGIQPGFADSCSFYGSFDKDTTARHRVWHPGGDSSGGSLWTAGPVGDDDQRQGRAADSDGASQCRHWITECKCQVVAEHLSYLFLSEDLEIHWCLIEMFTVCYVTTIFVIH